MLSRQLKSFKMKEVETVVDAYPHDSHIANKTNSILFLLGTEIADSEGSQT